MSESPKKPRPAWPETPKFWPTPKPGRHNEIINQMENSEAINRLREEEARTNAARIVAWGASSKAENAPEQAVNNMIGRLTAELAKRDQQIKEIWAYHDLTVKSSNELVAELEKKLAGVARNPAAIEAREKQLDALADAVDGQQRKLVAWSEKLDEMRNALEVWENALGQREQKLKTEKMELDSRLAKGQSEGSVAAVEAREALLEQNRAHSSKLKEEAVENLRRMLDGRQKQLDAFCDELVANERKVKIRSKALDERKAELKERSKELDARARHLEEWERTLKAAKMEFGHEELDARSKALDERQGQLSNIERQQASTRREQADIFIEIGKEKAELKERSDELHSRARHVEEWERQQRYNRASQEELDRAHALVQERDEEIKRLKAALSGGAQVRNSVFHICGTHTVAEVDRAAKECPVCVMKLALGPGGGGTQPAT